MKSWFEVLSDFDTPTEPRKEGKYRQASVVLSLMYLLLGVDYPYNMAKNFQLALALENRGTNILKYPGKLASLLKEMEEKELIIGVPDRRVGGTPRNLYRLNPLIIHSPRLEEVELNIEISLASIGELLVWLENLYSSDKDRKYFIINWSFIEKFDFITFLLCLKEAALAWESQSKKITPSDQQTGKNISQLIQEYISVLEYKYEPKSAITDIVLRWHSLNFPLQP